MHENSALSNEISRVAGHPPLAASLALFVNGRFFWWHRYSPNMLGIQPIIEEMGDMYEGNTLAQIYSHRSGLQQHLAALF